MPDIEIVGLKELQKALKDNVSMNDVKRVVKYHGGRLQAKAQDKAQFRGHFEGKRFVKPTGTLKRSIGIKIDDGGMKAIVEPGVHYGAYVELGTRFMEAQPYLKPAINIIGPQFLDDIEKLVKK